MTALPRFAGTLARLIPAGDREAILGDLLEESAFRGLAGPRRTWWLLGECGAIAAGLAAQRARGWFVLPPLGDVVAGVAADGSRALRVLSGEAVARGALFCGAVAILALAVELLVATLLSAGGLGG
jgi:hypothetical protein